MRISWSKDLEIGIDVIDSQHRRIVEYINELDMARRASEPHEAVGHVLDELVDYTLSHFAFEESLMEEAGYPFSNAHRKVHRLFARRVSDYVQKHKMGKDISVELLNTLENWLLNHIRHDDRDYAGVVRENMEAATKRVHAKKGSWFGKLFGA